MQLFSGTALFQLFVASGITADFIIWSDVTTGTQKACSAKNQTCACFEDSPTPETFNDNDHNYFQIQSGLFSPEQVLDVYLRDGWLVYVHNAQSPDLVGVL